jgi:hypothetical protein
MQSLRMRCQTDSLSARAYDEATGVFSLDNPS